MKFLIVAALVAYCSAAPGNYGAAPVAVAVAAPVAPVAAVVGYAQAPAVASVHETIHAGPAIAKTVVEHGVVGHRTVQVGTQAVQVGHEYAAVGQTVEHQAPYAYVAGAPVNTQQTVAIAPPALPVAAPGPYAIPPAPTNQGPAPIDTVVQERVAAPVRTHTVITPQVTRIEPELHVNKYAVDVPVNVPVPVHRDVVVTKTVEKPYAVDVPRAVPVAAPYKVHQVQEVVETPVINEHTVSVHQPIVHAQVAHAAVAYAHPAAYGINQAY
jgi:hypothetical protein